jgi:two-component system phosphate regulon response regulator PhoB
MDAVVLLVDGDAEYSQALARCLEREHWVVRCAARADEGIREARFTPRPDVVLLDVDLPDRSGLDVLRALRGDRESAEMAVMLVTGRDAEVDRVLGFELGADDYVIKPVVLRELILRVRTLLRRQRAARAARTAANGDRRSPETGSGSASADVHVVGRLRVDSAAHRVWSGGREIHPTPVEFRILLALSRRGGDVVGRDVLLTEVWGLGSDAPTRTVDTHIKRLRRRLGADGQLLETVRGVGYRLRDEREARPAAS